MLVKYPVICHYVSSLARLNQLIESEEIALLSELTSNLSRVCST